MDLTRSFSKSLSILGALLITLSPMAHAGDAQLCLNVFLNDSQRPREVHLVFDANSTQSIISAIATLPITALRGPVSETLRPAEAFLRHGSAARQLVINQLNALRLNNGMRYTVEHSWAVASLSVRIGKAAGMSTNELVHLFYAGLAHDLGKSVVPDEILNKPDKLTDEEFKLMKHHAVALKILLMTRASSDPELMEYIEAGGDHHERWDGKGYPNGKAGEQISFAGRIIGVADTFHAMISDRPYRKGMPLSKVLEILSRESQGGQFDTKILNWFLPQVSAEVETR